MRLDYAKPAPTKKGSPRPHAEENAAHSDSGHLAPSPRGNRNLPPLY
jgi:hypothetical protein